MSQLTAKEKELVRDVMENFAVKAGDNMILFYKILISNTPEYKKYFEQIKGTPLTEIHKSDWLRYELGPIMGSTFVSIVHEIDDPKAMREVVGRVINLPVHTNLNLMKKDYQKAFESLTKTIQIALTAEEFPQESFMAWSRLCNIILAMCDDELRKINPQPLFNPYGGFLKPGATKARPTLASQVEKVSIQRPPTVLNQPILSPAPQTTQNPPEIARENSKSDNSTASVPEQSNPSSAPLAAAVEAQSIPTPSEREEPNSMAN